MQKKKWIEIVHRHRRYTFTCVMIIILQTIRTRFCSFREGIVLNWYSISSEQWLRRLLVQDHVSARLDLTFLVLCLRFSGGFLFLRLFSHLNTTKGLPVSAPWWDIPVISRRLDTCRRPFLFLSFPLGQKATEIASHKYIILLHCLFFLAFSFEDGFSILTPMLSLDGCPRIFNFGNAI